VIGDSEAGAPYYIRGRLRCCRVYAEIEELLALRFLFFVSVLMYSLFLQEQMIINWKDQSELAVDGQSNFCLCRGCLALLVRVGNIGLLGPLLSL
jgi:hypothetical protein